MRSLLTAILVWLAACGKSGEKDVKASSMDVYVSDSHDLEATRQDGVGKALLVLLRTRRAVGDASLDEEIWRLNDILCDRVGHGKRYDVDALFPPDLMQGATVAVCNGFFSPTYGGKQQIRP
jgi:hypothetical protein